MSKITKKMLINVDQPEECRAVVIENGKLAEIIVQHSSQELVKGNIYLGVVTRVEPAIEAAFVDFGGKKYGFLPFKDVLPESYLQTGERKSRTRIQDVMVRGQKLLVQVVKESRDAKGPSLTNAATLPGRFMVLMVSSDSSGISRKIEDEAERKKMKQITADLGVPPNMGVIIRTAGLGRTKTELQKDMQALLKIWENIEEKVKNPDTKAPCLLYEGPDMVVRTVRDQFSNDTSEILVDDQDSYDALMEFMKLVMPRMRNRVTLYKDTKPLFSQYNVEEQIESIYKRRVELPSGGSIVIDVGEAMVSIDVNSGRTTGASALEETAIKTNLEAAEETARQLRLRDLGGLIVIDFIDMFQKKNKSLLEKQMKLSCKLDKARINYSRISRFGLLEMSRQRLAPPVKEGFFTACQYCDGNGHIKTDSSSALSVIRKIQEHVGAGNVKVLQVHISTQVINYLLNHKTKTLLELKENSGVDIQFESQEYLPYEKFTYTVLERKKEEDRVIEQKSKIQKDSRSEGEKSSEERGDKRGRGRRSSSGRGRGRRSSSSRRPAPKTDSKTEIQAESKTEIQAESKTETQAESKTETQTDSKTDERKPTRSPRRRPRRSPRNREAGSSARGGRSKADNVPTEQPTATPEGQDPPAPRRPSPDISRDSGEERQPTENVSRLHEAVDSKPAPFDPDPPKE